MLLLCAAIPIGSKHSRRHNASLRLGGSFIIMSRAHIALGNKTPAEYLLQTIPSPSAQGKKAAEN
jgi:hypothetical protein